MTLKRMHQMSVAPNHRLLPLLGLTLVAALSAASNHNPAVPTHRPTVKQQRTPQTTPVFEDLDRARRIVFAIDANGSMVNNLACLREQLNKTVNDLLPEQSFNIVFFRGDGHDQMSTELVPATAASKHL